MAFTDSGVSPSAVSFLFILWSVASFVLEIPTGTLGDINDRRFVLTASSVAKAVGFTLWTVLPSFAGFAAGFVMWALSSALASGTFEAMLYEELAAEGRATEYLACLARAQALAMGATMVAIVSAGPLYAIGGYGLVGSVSVAACVLNGAIAWSLPRRRSPSGADGESDSGESDSGENDDGQGFRATLIDGLATARRNVAVRRTVVVVALAGGLTAFDEYFGLVASEGGASPRLVPWLVGVATVGQLIGTAVADRAAALAPAALGRLTAGGGILVAAGAITGGWAGFVVLGAGYGAMNTAMVVSQARLQALIDSSARATVTSVAGLGMEVVALGVYTGFGLGSLWWGTATLFAVAAVPAVMIGRLTARLLPTQGQSTTQVPLPRSSAARSPGPFDCET